MRIFCLVLVACLLGSLSIGCDDEVKTHRSYEGSAPRREYPHDDQADGTVTRSESTSIMIDTDDDDEWDDDDEVRIQRQSTQRRSHTEEVVVP